MSNNIISFKAAQRIHDNSNCADYYDSDHNIVKCENCGDMYDGDDFPTEICSKCYDFWKVEEKQTLLTKLINIFKQGKNNG